MGVRTRGLANNVLSSGKLDATDAISGTIAAANIANASLDNATTFGSATGGVSQVAGDPPAPAEGDIWYNTTTGTLKFRSKVNAWASGGDLNTARNSISATGAGTQTAGLTASGNVPAISFVGTELYDGSAWTEVNDMNLNKITHALRGTQTSALTFGGFDGTRTALTESWNGTNWTEVNDLNTGRSDLGGSGTDNTSALAFTGKNPAINPPSGMLNLTESWNGTSWTEVNDTNTQKEAVVGIGTQTAALSVGGSDPVGAGTLGENESWNGTSWTEVGDLNTARFTIGGSGTQPSALVFGGGPGSLTQTEEWNGTSWSEVSDLSSGRAQLGGTGTSASALAFGGFTTTQIAATEEWGGVDTSFTVG